MSGPGPILIDCEGSGGPGHFPDGERAMCQMCGGWVPMEGDHVAPHQRDDVLARLDRGDFG